MHSQYSHISKADYFEQMAHQVFRSKSEHKSPKEIMNSMHKQLAFYGHFKNNDDKDNNESLKRSCSRYMNDTFKGKCAQLYKDVKQSCAKPKKPNTLYNMLDTYRKIYSNEETGVTARAKKRFGRGNRINQTKKGILTLLEKNSYSITKPQKLVVYGDISAKRQIAKGLLKAVIAQSENQMKKSSSCVNISQLSSANTSAMTNSCKQSSNDRSRMLYESMMKYPKAKAFEKKKEELYDSVFHLKKKNKEMIKVFKQRLDLFGRVEGC